MSTTVVPSAPHRVLIAQRVVLYIALWTAIGLVFTSQAYFMRGDLWRSMLSVMPRWYAWAALAPLAFWVDRRWLRAYTLGVRLLTLVPVGAVLVFGVEVIRYEASIWLLGPAQQSFGRFLLVGSYWDFLIYTVVMGLYIAWTLSAEAQQRQLREASLEARLAEARLQTLQAQLNPHFLFNALNTVSAYTETDPPTARRMMAHLGNLLRASLDHADRQEVPLHRELDFLDAYLAIEQARFQDRLTVSLDVADDVRDVLVPTFMLQPLVENAIRHGINTRMRGGHIAIRAWRTEDRVRIVVDDDGTGLPDGWRLEDHAGVGLANTQRRLRELYGAAHRLYVQPQVEGGVRVEIALPIRCARTASSPHSTPRIA